MTISQIRKSLKKIVSTNELTFVDPTDKNYALETINDRDLHIEEVFSIINNLQIKDNIQLFYDLEDEYDSL